MEKESQKAGRMASEEPLHRGEWGSGGRGEIFCRTTAHKNPKRLDF